MRAKTQIDGSPSRADDQAGMLRADSVSVPAGDAAAVAVLPPLLSPHDHDHPTPEPRCHDVDAADSDDGMSSAGSEGSADILDAIHGGDGSVAAEPPLLQGHYSVGRQIAGGSNGEVIEMEYHHPGLRPLRLVAKTPRRQADPGKEAEALAAAKEEARKHWRFQRAAREGGKRGGASSRVVTMYGCLVANDALNRPLFLLVLSQCRIILGDVKHRYLGLGDGPVFQRAMLHFFRSALEILEQFVAQGMAHRDVKPDNLAIQIQQGKGQRRNVRAIVKALDVGSMALVTDTHAQNRVNGTTLRYVAPEVMAQTLSAASVSANPALDMHAWGVTAQGLLGMPPLAFSPLELDRYQRYLKLRFGADYEGPFTPEIDDEMRRSPESMARAENISDEFAHNIESAVSANNFRALCQLIAFQMAYPLSENRLSVHQLRVLLCELSKLATPLTANTREQVRNFYASFLRRELPSAAAAGANDPLHVSSHPTDQTLNTCTI